jgi:hypothetical protein
VFPAVASSGSSTLQQNQNKKANRENPIRFFMVETVLEKILQLFRSCFSLKTTRNYITLL